MSIKEFIRENYQVDRSKSIRVAAVLRAYRANGGITTRSAFLCELGESGYKVALDGDNTANILGITTPRDALVAVNGRITRCSK